MGTDGGGTMQTLTRLLAILGVVVGFLVGAPGISDAATNLFVPGQTTAGYWTSGLAPTSASTTVVIPSFTCTGVQFDILSIELAYMNGAVSDEVLVHCSGSGVPAVLSTFVCNTQNCVSTLTVAPGDRLKMLVTSKGATMTDVTTKRTAKSGSSGNTTGAVNANFGLLRVDQTTPTFNKMSFMAMTVDGVPLTTANSFSQDMTGPTPIVEVRASTLTLGKGSLIFKHT
jgi:hypothetical protein